MPCAGIAIHTTPKLPTHVSPLEEQVERAYANFKSFRTDLEKHVFLRALQEPHAPGRSAELESKDAAELGEPHRQ